jgi:hypothetical protein
VRSKAQLVGAPKPSTKKTNDVAEPSLNDEPYATAGFTLIGEWRSPSAVRLQYSVTHQGEKTGCDYQIRLDRTPCHYRNWRYWWICPLWKEGRFCGRRCGILYLPYGARTSGADSVTT